MSDALTALGKVGDSDAAPAVNEFVANNKAATGAGVGAAVSVGAPIIWSYVKARKKRWNKKKQKQIKHIRAAYVVSVLAAAASLELFAPHTTRTDAPQP